MTGLQADFLVQFAVHRLLRRLAVLDAALRKLPRILPDALTPKHLILCVCQNDADVRAITFSVYHDSPHTIYRWLDCSIFQTP
jgi:hypothetical protein